MWWSSSWMCILDMYFIYTIINHALSPLFHFSSFVALFSFGLLCIWLHEGSALIWDPVVASLTGSGMGRAGICHELTSPHLSWDLCTVLWSCLKKGIPVQQRRKKITVKFKLRALTTQVNMWNNFHCSWHFTSVLQWHQWTASMSLLLAQEKSVFQMVSFY